MKEGEALGAWYRDPGEVACGKGGWGVTVADHSRSAVKKEGGVIWNQKRPFEKENGQFCGISG